MAIKSPPGLIPLSHLSGEELQAHLRFNRVTDEKGRYLPFDELQYRIKKGENVDVAWTLTRLARNAAIQRINYCNEAGEQAGFNITPVIAEAYELVDKRATALALKDQTERLRGAGAELSQLRLEEPITSSQLEGANTTTLVARKMLETGRSPRTEDEHMIAGNARLMAEIPHLLAEPLTTALIRQLHAIGMGGINDAKYRPGEFRETDDVVIADYDGNIVHQPPAAALLLERLEKVCQWLNSHEGYIHPLIRACILHFMLAHEHPFRDGNGRTSRALFYWYMLKSGYDVFKYISISRLLHAAPVKYAASCQYTESDGMDLTYFLPGTYVRPHRHPHTFELLLPLRGRFVVLNFDDRGTVTHRAILGETCTVLEMAAGTWHAVLSLDTGGIIFEVKHGGYQPVAADDYAHWAPAEGEPGTTELMAWYAQAQVGDSTFAV